MKLLILLFFSTLTFVCRAQNASGNLKAIPIVENRIHELDGGSIIVFGKSRVVIPIVLPENTIEWYYIFSSYSNTETVEAKSSQINLVSQLARVIDETGTTTAALSYLLAPSGSSASNVYVFDDIKNASNFENKSEYDLFATYWYPRSEFSIRSARQGKQKIGLTADKKYYLGIQAGTSPVVVKIEVVAIVDESVVSSNEWTFPMKNKVKTLMKETFLANDVQEQDADKLSNCILSSIVKEYPQDIFFSLSEQAINSLVAQYARNCYKNEIKLEESDNKKKAGHYGDMGWGYFEAGDIEKAIEYSNKALELENTLAYVQANLGLFYLIKGDDLKANDFYADAVINFKKDKLTGKSYLKAAIDDINSSRTKFTSSIGYETLLKHLNEVYKNW